MPLGGTNDDSLGTKRYVKGLISFIERSSTPITIALQGEWGSGKTSLINKLHSQLCSHDASFLGITINTWEYSMLSTPEMAVVKIMEYLVNTLSGYDPIINKKFKNILKVASNIAFRVGREALKIATNHAGAILTEAVVGSSIDGADLGTDNVSIADLRRDLNKAVENSLKGKGKHGVIVFVDDLDRLNPPLAVEILELLKNLFTLDKCIFVLAIDYDVVVKGLKPKFGELTEGNEREFRSFFDKIIQVPFSLPVNSYTPMDFVLGALKEIGYITDSQGELPHVKESFSKIVEASVGKNPRAIKRLINTLSLIDCITKTEAKTDDSSDAKALDTKILSAIIVAIQICYPKVYRMLTREPEFTLWDLSIFDGMGMKGISNSADSESDTPSWQDILYRVCTPDAFLLPHRHDIELLLNTIIDIAKKYPDRSLGEMMRQVINISSVTGISSGLPAEDPTTTRKKIISRLHDGIKKYISSLRHDIAQIKPKNNTGNGGLRINYGKEGRHTLDITFTTHLDPATKHASIRTALDMAIRDPQKRNALSLEEIMAESRLSDALERFDAVLSDKLRRSATFFHGNAYDNGRRKFDSYTDELRYVQTNNILPAENITHNPGYWIDISTPDQAADSAIISTLADIIIANYDFRSAMLRDGESE